MVQLGKSLENGRLAKSVHTLRGVLKNVLFTPRSVKKCLDQSQKSRYLFLGPEGYYLSQPRGKNGSTTRVYEQQLQKRREWKSSVAGQGRVAAFGGRGSGVAAILRSFESAFRALSNDPTIAANGLISISEIGVIKNTGCIARVSGTSDTFRSE